MRFKYYLRGLGIGILVTAFILGVSFRNYKQMSDEEVKARARELGMVESTTLSNIAGAHEKETTQEDIEQAQETNDAEEIKGSEETSDIEETVTETMSTEPQDANDKETEVAETATDESESLSEGYEDTEWVTITIQSGESSVTVSKTLFEAGLVENATEYDRFLCANGYDKRIVTGTYHIPIGTTNEDIAKIITGKLSLD